MCHARLCKGLAVLTVCSNLNTAAEAAVHNEWIQEWIQARKREERLAREDGGVSYRQYRNLQYTLTPPPCLRLTLSLARSPSPLPTSLCIPH